MKLHDKFKELKEKEEGAFMAHVYYGDPTENFSLQQIKTLTENGTDFIEFGIPFTDPTADGPTFQNACKRAIENGMLPSKCISGIKKVRELGVEVPLIVTTYYNIVHHMGVEYFIKKIKEAGAQVTIVPNVPVEEAEPLLSAGKKHGIDIIQLITPASSDARVKKIVDVATGFIYVVTRAGVTGARKDLQHSTLELIKRIRKHTDIPLMAGFGISKPEHATAVVNAGASGAIVGSALGRIYEKYISAPESALPEIAEFTKSMKNAMRKRPCAETINKKEGENEN